MRDYWGVSLLLLEMEFYLWCEEIVEYDYICYDYFIGFSDKSSSGWGNVQKKHIANLLRVGETHEIAFKGWSVILCFLTIYKIGIWREIKFDYSLNEER